MSAPAFLYSRMSSLLAHRLVLLAGFGFLYVPIILLIIFSFNESRLVTVWAGFSTRWYGALFKNEQMLSSVWNSLVLALASASLATILGTLAAYGLARTPRFKGRMIFAAMIYAPLVMPEVISGLALLLLFVALDLDRGLPTMSMDLGATPLSTFFSITLPLAFPAIQSGFLLAMMLSLDDLVIASFTSGPGSTTLPMRIYSQVRLGVTPEVNAISALLIGVIAFALLAGALLRQRTHMLSEADRC